MTSDDEHIHAAIARQAGEWFAAIEDRPLNEVDRVAFTAWLKTSPVHVKEFLGVSVIARDLPSAADDPDVPIETLLEWARADDTDSVVRLDQAPHTGVTTRNRPRVRRTWALAASVAAVVVLSAALVWRTHDGELFGLPKTYETARGEQGAWRLPDGSVLRLNTEGVATVHYSAGERVVDLHRGQAYFQVARDSHRRFRVAAGKAQVVAVGTEFDIYRKPNRTVVTVVEGMVTVLVGPVSGQTQQVTAGQQLVIDSGKMWAQPRPQDLDQAEAWLHRKIVFQGRPLGEVVEEFNRYAQVPVEIDDPALRTLLVSGSFDAYDTETFLGFLESLDGVLVQRTAASIHVLQSIPARGQDPPASH